MTLIIGIQLKDSIIIAADRRLTQEKGNQKFYLISDFYRKITYSDNVAISGSGEALIIKRMSEKISNKPLLMSLSNIFAKEILRRKQEIGHHEQIAKTKLFVSSCENNRLALQVFSTDQSGNIYSNTVEPMTIELTMRSENINKLSHLLVDFHANLKNIEDFQYQEEWLNCYIEKLRKIFHLCNSYDETVSSSFDICAHTMSGILFRTLD